MAELFDRLQCVTTVLGALRGKPHYVQVSHMEAAVITRMIRESSISNDDIAMAMTRVAMVGFQSKDEGTSSKP